MSFIGKNIKKIRSVKKLSQNQFGELFKLNRGTIGAYEEERAEPKIETIIQIANHFGLSVDILLVKELTVNDLYSFNIINKKLDEAHHFEPEPVSLFQNKSIGLVSGHQIVEYLVNHDNRDFISKLPQINLPIEFKENCRAFEMEGSEMEYYQNGLHHGDILLCKACELQSSEMEVDKVYTVVTSDLIKTRRLQSMNKTVLEFRSDDPNYPVQLIQRNEVKQLWEVIGVYSTYLNPPKMIEERVMLIENQLKVLKEQIKS